MTTGRKRRVAANHLPSSRQFDHEPLLTALKAASQELNKYQQATGHKTPAHAMAALTRDYMVAFGRLTAARGRAEDVLGDFTVNDVD